MSVARNAAVAGQNKPPKVSPNDWTAAKVQADKARQNAYVFAQGFYNQKSRPSAREAVDKVTQMLTGTGYSPVQLRQIAMHAVNLVYPRVGYNPPKQVGGTTAVQIATGAQKYGGVNDVKKQKDGSYIISTGNGQVWKVVGNTWTNVYTPHRVR